MSIIYDALKKSQKVRTTRPTAVSRRMRRPTHKQLVITLLIFSSMMLVMLLISLATQTKPAPKAVAVVKPVAVKPMLASAPRLMLDGVFLSDSEKLAMINRRAYHIGDQVYDMKVVGISLEKVTLQGKNRSLILKNSFAQLD